MPTSTPNLPLESSVGQRLLLAFQGKDRLPDSLTDSIRRCRPSGFTLFRHLNVDNPAQVRLLTASLQSLAKAEGLPPFLIGVDQEGGQLNALSGATELPGNLALGAAGSVDLARRAGEVLGCELAALGINVDFAPACDVNSNPQNPVIGTRSFGEDPRAVARLASAVISGIQSQGVAAVAKHFPGHGDTSGDSHYGIPSVPHSLDRLNEVEFPPFREAVAAGVKLVMSAHLSLPAVDDHPNLPATLSPKILTGLLRGEFGFEGVIITDAMDMKAIRQGDALGEDAVRAAAAGADLLLLLSDPADHDRVHRSLLEALAGGRLDRTGFSASLRRIHALKQWVSSNTPQPDLSLVGCAAHRSVAAEIAAASITLVRDRDSLLPLRLDDRRLAVVLPKPADLTPADTSSFVAHSLPAALRRFHPAVDAFEVPHRPQGSDIAAVLEQLTSAPDRYAAVIVGTINAFASQGQAALVNAVIQTGAPTIAAALRMPTDLASFPQVSTYLCVYSLLEPSMHALARVLFGEAAPTGALPVSIPGLYPLGYRME